MITAAVMGAAAIGADRVPVPDNPTALGTTAGREVRGNSLLARDYASASATPQAAGGEAADDRRPRGGVSTRRPPTDCSSTLPREAGRWHVSGRSGHLQATDRPACAWLHRKVHVEKPAKSGVKSNDLDEEGEVIDPLEKGMKKRFEIAWATLKTNAHPDGLWASAYHIKVAVRDGNAVWLSSGNWQSSNQPDVHPFVDNPAKLPAGFQRKYNRDYHAIAINDNLASIYETYIKRDLEMSAAQAGEAVSFAAPDLFVPEEPEEVPAFAAPPQLFPPLRLNRAVRFSHC
jgi:hypothetical protein